MSGSFVLACTGVRGVMLAQSFLSIRELANPVSAYSGSSGFPVVLYRYQQTRNNICDEKNIGLWHFPSRINRIWTKMPPKPCNRAQNTQNRSTWAVAGFNWCRSGISGSKNIFVKQPRWCFGQFRTVSGAFGRKHLQKPDFEL